MSGVTNPSGPGVVPGPEGTAALAVFVHPDQEVVDNGRDTLRKIGDVATSLRKRPIPGVEICVPSPATPDEVAIVHDPEFVEAFVTGTPPSRARSAALGWDPEFVKAVFASTGGARDAALRAFRGRTIAGSLSAGLHHARWDAGFGYCTFNGLVVAAVAARDAGARRIIIVDFDAHCGGGTAGLIAGVHEIEQVDVSVVWFDSYASRRDAVLLRATGEDYLDRCAQALEYVLDPDDVDLVIYNAGMDPHQGAGGALGITDEVLAERERMVFEWAEVNDLPLAFVLAGGYTIGIDQRELVELHRLTIAEAARRVAARG